MNLTTYLDEMRNAETAADLEAATQLPHKHRFSGPTWTRISKVRIEAGRRICAAHPLGKFVPRAEPRRRLVVCGEERRIGVGHNAAGVRWVWADAEMFCKAVLARRGFSGRAIKTIWDWWREYPHRALQAVEQALAGEFPDPPLNRLIMDHVASSPINCDGSDGRARRPCRCGGTRFDWGCCDVGYVYRITWRCNGCPRVYVEYVTSERLSEIRRRPGGDRVARIAEVRR